MLIDSVMAVVNDDHFENEFQVVIPPFPGCLDPVGINFRAIGVTTPDISWENYKVHWKTESADKPAGKQSTEKTLTIKIRIDKYMIAYKSFMNWANLIHSNEYGTMSADYVNGVSLIRVPITILYLNANGIPVSSGEVFKGCYIDGIPSRSYTMDSGNPQILDFRFRYINTISVK